MDYCDIEWFALKTPSSNNTREDSTHGHHQIVNTKTRWIIFFAAKNEDAPYSQKKKKLPGADCGSDHELIAKFRLKLKKYGKSLGHSGMI